MIKIQIYILLVIALIFAVFTMTIQTAHSQNALQIHEEVEKVSKTAFTYSIPINNHYQVVCLANEITSNSIQSNHTIYTDLDLPNVDTSMKTFMGYKAITNTGSKQWELQQSAITNEDGFRIYNDKYMIALGTFYSPYVGIEFEIEFDTGKVIQCITGDVKNNIHTDKTNRYIEHNGNVLEFIVDTEKIGALSRKMGDMSYSDIEGNIVRISRVEIIK